MLDREKIRNVLGRLPSVETDLGDPAVLSDAKRYRAALRDHAFLKKLESASAAYEKTLSDIAGSEELLSDPDFKEDAERELETLREQLGDARVGTGRFGAHMKVELLNDGPVSIELLAD